MNKEKPPIGLVPRSVCEHIRARDIIESMLRYNESNKRIPEEWINELGEIESRKEEKEFKKVR